MVFLASPSDITPPESGYMWAACQHTLIGSDGTEWDLSHGGSGLALQAGVRGMRNAPVIRYSSKAAAVAGSFYRGSNTDEREVFWPVKVFADGGSPAWIEHNNRFWETLDEDQLVTWVITQPTRDNVPAVKRTLKVRYTGLADDADDIDPGLAGWCVYGINLIAEQPFWLGESVTRTFQNPAGQNYYGGTGGGGFGPPFYISPGSTTSSASIPNEGDVPAWPVWRIAGPTTSVTVGLNGRTIGFPMTLTSGQWIELDTDPTDQMAKDQDGVDRTAQLSTIGFAEIPKGAEVPLTITLTGTGSVSCTVTPRYRRGM